MGTGFAVSWRRRPGARTQGCSHVELRPPAPLLSSGRQPVGEAAQPLRGTCTGRSSAIVVLRSSAALETWLVAARPGLAERASRPPSTETAADVLPTTRSPTPVSRSWRPCGDEHSAASRTPGQPVALHPQRQDSTAAIRSKRRRGVAGRHRRGSADSRDSSTSGATRPQRLGGAGGSEQEDRRTSDPSEAFNAMPASALPVLGGPKARAEYSQGGEAEMVGRKVGAVLGWPGGGLPRSPNTRAISSTAAALGQPGVVTAVGEPPPSPSGFRASTASRPGIWSRHHRQRP